MCTLWSQIDEGAGQWPGRSTAHGALSEVGGLGPLVPMSNKRDKETANMYRSFSDIRITFRLSDSTPSSC